MYTSLNPFRHQRTWLGKNQGRESIELGDYGSFVLSIFLGIIENTIYFFH